MEAKKAKNDGGGRKYWSGSPALSPLRRAICASLVIASHSSRIMSLNLLLKMVRVEAKSWISLRTMLIPRSSEAFSSRTMLPVELPYIWRAKARIVDVLPVPGGP